MDNWTFETENKGENLETYEWDNTWLEQTGNTQDTRVLYIGDSISCGIRNRATTVSQNKLLFDGFGTSKALDNPYYIPSLKVFAAQGKTPEFVLFNNGLHGWHMNDTEYKSYYEQMIRFLTGEFTNSALMLVLTTDIMNPQDQKATVIRRNEAVKELAKTYNIPVIDLFSLSRKYSHLHNTDGVHFTDEGNNLLAKEIVKCITKL